MAALTSIITKLPNKFAAARKSGALFFFDSEVKDVVQDGKSVCQFFPSVFSAYLAWLDRQEKKPELSVALHIPFFLGQFRISICPALKDKKKATEEAKAAVKANNPESDPDAEQMKGKTSPFGEC